MLAREDWNPRPDWLDDYEEFAEGRTRFKPVDGTGEPGGWHRHPNSGRRRPKGDPAAEYLAL